mgnify:CR=1 FL=1
MNKILNINLGGYPFTIDDDAYVQLNKYLSAIENHFSTSEGCEEIIEDIEVRMAELFNDALNGRSIIGTKELEEVIAVMGKPEDFGATSWEEEPIKEEKYREYDHRRIKTGKRLFRDPDDKVLGGVCSGIAAYFGIEDPLWIRILFIVLFVSGISALVYFFLWAIVPVAKTTSDKLRMKGEAATVSNIAKSIEEELKDLSKKITEIGKDLSSKKKF